MAENNSEFEEMSEAVAEQFQQMLFQASEPSEPGEPVSVRIRRAARRTRLTYSQAKRGWYREWVRIPADLFLSVQASMHEIADEQERLVRARIENLEIKRRTYERIHERRTAAVADLFEQGRRGAGKPGL